MLTQKCKIYPQGILSKQYKYTEMQRLNIILLKKAQKEAEERAFEQSQRPPYQPPVGYRAINADRDDEDDDEDDDDYDGGV